VSYDQQWVATGCAGGVTAGDRLSGTTPVIKIWAFDTIVKSSLSSTTKPNIPKFQVSMNGGGEVDFDMKQPPVQQEEFVVNECTGLLECSAAAEGKGHSTSITSLSWIPNIHHNNKFDDDDENGSRPLYHLISGSRDGEIRQWCCRLTRPELDVENHSQHVVGASDPVPPSSALLQLVRVFRSGDKQVSACAFLTFGAMPPMQIKKTPIVDSTSKQLNVKNRKSIKSEDANSKENSKKASDVSDSDSDFDSDDEKADDVGTSKAASVIDPVKVQTKAIQERSKDVVDKFMETLVEELIDSVVKGHVKSTEDTKEFASSMVQVIVGDAAGIVNIWSLHLPDRTPNEEEDLVREKNSAPSPRLGGKPAGRRLAPKPPAARCSRIAEFDHCTVRKCLPVNIGASSQNSNSVLLALSNPFSSAGVYL
jgi:hypothetical protein